MGNEELYQEASAAIVGADRAAAEDIAKRALAAGMTPADIMQNGFVMGIQEVGELFESGELFLPELMMAADAMAGATEVTNAALEAGAATTKGRVVIGTVQGDVHDIGKAIVIAYLKANGYEVTDLGRDVPAQTFIAKAKEGNADIIGMSALLTTTMEEQKKVIKVIKEEGLSFKTVVGGAPATQRWADQIGADAYAEDANDGVKKIDALLGGSAT
jgi:trimethylamine corrinoid protein